MAFFDATKIITMKFNKSFDTPNPIPEQAISNAVSQMQHGMLYRYGHNSDEYSEVSKLEAAFGEYTGHKYVIAVNSCGSAMFIALKAMGIEPGEGVFTNAFTFTAVPSSIVHANAIPRYIECNDQYIIDLDDFELQIGQHPEVKTFILSHMRGHIAELDKIQALCDKHNIRLIEDCAHGLGKRWSSTANAQQYVGHHCEIACYSTQSHKLLNSGEGGFIATNDEKLATYCILAAGSYEGLYKKHLARPMNDELFEAMKFDVPNFSLRMNNLTAAILRPQIELLDERIAAYQDKYQRIIALLTGIEQIHIPEPVENTQNIGDSLQFNLINLTEDDAQRFVSTAADRGVQLQVFGKNNNARDFRNWQYSFDALPKCEKTATIISSACDLRLPSSFILEDIELIGAILTEVMTETMNNSVALKKAV